MRGLLKVSLFCAVFSTGYLHADTLELLARTENMYQQPENRLFSADQGMFLWGRANFCINDALPKGGKYFFRFELTDPNGTRVLSKESARNDVPLNPMLIELREYVLPANVFTRHGQYTLTVSFIEDYGVKTLQVNRSYSFEIFSGGRVTDLTQAPVLLQPADGAVVTNYPNFLWTRVPQGAKYNVYISEKPTPNEFIYVQKEGIAEQQYIYDGQLPLRNGVRYYWNVRVTDSMGTPVGLNNGFSQTFSFTVNDIGVSETLKLIYPRNDIQDSMPRFRWTGVFPINVPAEYTLVLSERIAANVVWRYSGNTVQYQYQPDSPVLKPKVKYFWSVIGKDRRTGETKESETASFVYTPDVRVVNEELKASQTTAKGFIVNDRDIAVMGATVYFKYLDPSETAKEFSLVSGPGGAFEVTDLPAGKYQLYAEIKMAERYNNYSAQVQIREGIQNNLRIVMKNNLGRRTFIVRDERGWPVPNANIVLRNAAFTWKFKTDQQGEYTVDLEDGVYNFEASLLPEFGRTFQNDAHFSGVGVQNIRIQRTKNGATRLKVVEAGTNAGMENLQIEGEPKK